MTEDRGLLEHTAVVRAHSPVVEMMDDTHARLGRRSHTHVALAPMPNAQGRSKRLASFSLPIPESRVIFLVACVTGCNMHRVHRACSMAFTFLVPLVAV